MNQWGTFQVSNPNAPQGDTATFQITDPLQGALTTSQAIYQLGQPIQVTYSETNTSDQAVTTTVLNPVLHRLLHNGQQVSPVMDPLGSGYETIGPGQTVQQQFTVSQADFGGSDSLENLTGSFAVQVYDVPAAPGEFTADFQIVAVPPGAIVSSVTTDHSVYQVGQPIQITFTETNTGTQPVTVSLSPTDFTVSAQALVGYSPVWQSNPENDGQPPASVTLQPGQSVTQTATWNGTITETAFQQGTATTYAVNQWGTFQVSNPNAPQGDTATFQITDPLQGALTTSQAIYQLGQPIQVIYSETNTSDQAVTTTVLNPVLYRLLHNGQQVSPVMDPLGSGYETIGPGQTARHQFTLSQAAFGGSDSLQNLTGSFAVQVYDVPAAPGDFTADFEIVAAPAGAIVSSITTNQPVYQAGQTVTMTFTETNTSNQAVMVPTGQNGFGFDQVSPASYSNIPLLPGPTMTGWSTLQPGQSWTQTETWPVFDPVSGPYTVKISNFFDLNGHNSTFEVVGASTSANLSVTTNHSAYTPGESVRVSVTIPGKSATTGVSSREQITVLDGTQVVARLTRRIPAVRLKQLAAGHSVTLTTTWNGRPNQREIHALKPGSYSILVTYGDFSGRAAITIGRRGS